MIQGCKLKRIVVYTLLISWMLLIFFFSHQPANESDKSSEKVINIIINIVENISNHKLTENEIETISNYLVFPIRKLAHFSLYFILGILFYNVVNLYNIEIKNLLIISILFCILYACSDEIHQLFVLGRSCELRDVLIDSLGSITGILIINKIFNKNHKKLNSK